MERDIVALIKRLEASKALPSSLARRSRRPSSARYRQRLPDPSCPTHCSASLRPRQKVGIRWRDHPGWCRGRDLNSLVSIPLAIAGWLRYLLAIDDNGNAFEVSADPLKDELQAKLSGIEFGKPETVTDQLDGILSNASIFGSDLTKTVLADKIKAYFKAEIAGAGAVRKTLHEAVNG